MAHKKSLEARSPEQVMQAYLLAFVDGDMAALNALFADDAIVEFPYAFDPMPRRVEGIAAIREYYKNSPDIFDFRPYQNVRVHKTEDPDLVFAEFTSDATVLPTGHDYPQEYIATLKTRHGKIIHYREFWDPILVQTAFGGADDTRSAFEGN